MAQNIASILAKFAPAVPAITDVDAEIKLYQMAIANGKKMFTDIVEPAIFDSEVVDKLADIVENQEPSDSDKRDIADHLKSVADAIETAAYGKLIEQLKFHPDYSLSALIDAARSAARKEQEQTQAPVAEQEQPAEQKISDEDAVVQFAKLMVKLLK